MSEATSEFQKSILWSRSRPQGVKISLGVKNRTQGNDSCCGSRGSSARTCITKVFPRDFVVTDRKEGVWTCPPKNSYLFRCLLQIPFRDRKRPPRETLRLEAPSPTRSLKKTRISMAPLIILRVVADPALQKCFLWIC